MQVQGCKIRVQTLVQRFTGLFARKQLRIRAGSQQDLILHRAQHGQHGDQKRCVGLRGHKPFVRVCLPALRVQPCTAQVKRAQQQELPVLLQCLPESFKSCVRRIAAELCQPKGREFRRQQNAVLAARKRSIPR